MLHIALTTLAVLVSDIQTRSHFTINNRSSATESDVAVLERRLEEARDAITKFLGKPAPASVEVLVSEGPGIPNARDGKIELFYSKGSIRLDAVEHELVHVTMGYNGRGNHLPGVEEGLASFAGESLNSAASFPHIGQSADAWATYFLESAKNLPLHSVLTGMYRFSELGTLDDLRCWEGYIEGSSFVRWMVETKGWSVFWQFYDETKEFGLTAKMAESLDREWRAALLAKKVRPAQPEKALPQDDTRYQAWTRMLKG